MHRHLSVIRRRPSKISNSFFSKTVWPIKSQILYGASRGRGKESWSRHLGHMTKMAATPIYDKIPSTFIFSGTSGRMFTKLGMLHRRLLSIIVCSNADPRLTPILRLGQILQLRLFYRKRYKQWIFQTLLQPVT